MYKVSDVVIYGTEGICTVTDITEMKFGDEVSEYYILAPVGKEANTVYVPKSNEKVLKRMRHILTESDAKELISSLPMEPMEWIANDRDRQTAYKNILLCGNPKEMFTLISTLYHRQAEQLNIGKKLHASDERILKEAEKMIFGEISYVLGIKVQEVAAMVSSKTA